MEETNTPKKKQRRSFGNGGSILGRRSIGGGGRSSLLMSSAVSSSSGGFGGFSTAWEVKDTLAAAAAAAQQQKKEKENREDVVQKASSADGANGIGSDHGGIIKPRKIQSGSINEAMGTADDDAEEERLASTHYASLPYSRPISLILTLRGTQFHKDDVGDDSTFYKLLKKGCQDLILEREPENEYDAMAIRVGYYMYAQEGGGDKDTSSNKQKSKADPHDKVEADGDDTEKKNAHDNDMNDGDIVESNNNTDAEPQQQLRTIGHIAKEQAKVLSPYLDAGCLRLDTVVVTGKDTGNKSWYQLHVSGIAKNIDSMLHQLDAPLFSNVVDIDSFLSKGLARLDLEESKSAHYTIDQLPPPLPWAPLPDYERDQEPNDDSSQFGWPWEPYDRTVAQKFLPNREEVEAAQLAKWPPSDEVLRKLGMGPKDDAEWWDDVAGLRPPVEWDVTGPHDLLDQVSLGGNRTKRQRVAALLDGAVHGVTNVWTDGTLDAMRETMHSKDFWIHRGADAFIRSFGGPYVLGQAPGKLKLIRGVPHTDLTAKIARGHNLVYAATHLKLPHGPGFNVIVFGLNLRRGGFHYHQDHIGDVKAKAAPLVPRQPVATTVFYERPDLDDKKEVVNWRPIDNWTGVAPKSGTTHHPTEAGDGERGTINNNYYLAARSVRTTHGMIHIQRAGLQAKTKHGIFHAPGDEDERRGYRVAITARVAWPDAEERLAPFIERGEYCRTLGPDGQDKLPSSTV